MRALCPRGSSGCVGHRERPLAVTALTGAIIAWALPQPPASIISFARETPGGRQRTRRGVDAGTPARTGADDALAGGGTMIHPWRHGDRAGTKTPARSRGDRRPLSTCANAGPCADHVQPCCTPAPRKPAASETSTPPQFEPNGATMHLEPVKTPNVAASCSSDSSRRHRRSCRPPSAFQPSRRPVGSWQLDNQRRATVQLAKPIVTLPQSRGL